MISIACDHGGYRLKEQVKTWLVELEQPHLDRGCFGEESVDYPDYAQKVVDDLLSGQATRGILICGTGIGMSLAANRHAGIRATLVGDCFSARMARAHNDSNVLVLGGRVLGPGLAREILEIWLKTEFMGNRHQQRLDKIDPAHRSG